MKTTRITLHEDQPTGISSTTFKANIDGYAFNMGYIQDRDPELALELVKIYERASKLKGVEPLDANDPRFAKVRADYKDFMSYAHMDYYDRDTRMRKIIKEFDIPTPVEMGRPQSS